MCGIKSKKNSRHFGTGCVLPVLFALFLLFAASPLSAAADWFFLNGNAKSTQEESQPAPVEVITATVTSQEQTYQVPVLQEAYKESAEPSTSYNQVSLEKLETKLTSLANDLNSSIMISGDSKTELAALKNDFEAYKKIEEAEDAMHQQAIFAVAELEKANKTQSDQIADISARLDEAESTKAYAKLGGTIGFKDAIPTFGVTGALGIRWGGSFLTELGASYMVGSFAGSPILAPSIDNLSVSACIGWEW